MCANNATCVNGINNYMCECPAGYTGQFCQFPLNPCANSPCLNGLCQPIPSANSGYVCFCQAGWTGPHCDTMLDNWYNFIKNVILTIMLLFIYLKLVVSV